MRRYSDPVEVRSVPMTTPMSEAVSDPVSQSMSEPASEPVSGRRPVDAGAGAVRSPQAFIWHGRLYVVRRILAHWRERRSWWHDALDPAPGQPTGIAVASREQHVWRVEASRGQAHGTGVFELSSDGAEGADPHWRLVRVAD